MRPKKKIKTSTLKNILAVEAVLLVLICLGAGFVAIQSSGFSLIAPQAVESSKSIPVATPIWTVSSITTHQPTRTDTHPITETLTPTATATLTPTFTSLPTDIPSPTQDFNFSLDSANTIPPDDILQEVGYYGGAGGGIRCDSERMEPYVLGYGPDAKFELMVPIWYLVCNLPPNQDVTEIVRLPDGTTQHFVLKSSENGDLLSRYVASLESPPGEYLFSFDVGDIHLEETLNVIKPQAVRLYVIGEDSDEINNERQIILYNFLPNEKIRLFAYSRENLKIKVWRTYTANSNGMVVINNELEKLAYFYTAVGEDSGEVYHSTIAQQLNPPPGSFLGLWFHEHLYCPNASNSATDLSNLQYAEVIVDSLPAFDDKDVTLKETLPRGKVVQVSGAFCKDHTWFVRLRDPEGKYIQEKDGTQVFLRPLDITATPWSSSTPTPPSP